MTVGCAETPSDIIDDFVTESGHDFADCGEGGRCDTPGDCLLGSFETCSPARATLAEGAHFILPSDDPGGCVVVWFQSSQDSSGETLEKHECLDLVRVGACAERSNCAVTNRWHL